MMMSEETLRQARDPHDTSVCLRLSLCQHGTTISRKVIRVRGAESPFVALLLNDS